jgi:hypothetical protein
MGFAVYHAEKGSINANQIGRHIDRNTDAKHTFEHSNKNADNHDFTPDKFKNMGLQDAIDLRIQEGYKGKTIRKDAVKYVTHILTATHEDMKEIFKDQEKANTWITENYRFISEEFGQDNIVKFTLHLDEKTPHIHVVTVPLTADGRLSAKEMYGDIEKMSKRQDLYAERMQRFGLERGIKHTGIKHETSKEYYGRIDYVENQKDILQSKVDEKINNFSISLMDITLGKLETRKNEFKADLSDFVKKEVQSIGKSLIAQNTELKKQIREVSKGVQELKVNTQAKDIKEQISVIEYLSSKCKSGELVFEGKRGVEFYFGYPGQKTGSISVNTQKNVFFDHQTGKGGDVIKACEIVENKTFKEVLNELSKGVDKSAVSIYNQKNIDTEDENKQKTTITAVFDDIKHPALIKYAQQRGILTKSIALKEVHYERDGKNYFALGWKNASGGYDLRNENFKGKLGTNDITFIKVGDPEKLNTQPSKIVVFEGFSDYLSWRKNKPDATDFKAIIMNSTSNIEKCIDEIKRHKVEDITLFLDRDQAGNKATERIIDSFKCDVIDQRENYFGKSKDLNEHYQFKLEHEKALRQQQLTQQRSKQNQMGR